MGNYSQRPPRANVSFTEISIGLAIFGTSLQLRFLLTGTLVVIQIYAIESWRYSITDFILHLAGLLDIRSILIVDMARTSLRQTDRRTPKLKLIYIFVLTLMQMSAETFR